MDVVTEEEIVWAYLIEWCVAAPGHFVSKYVREDGCGVTIWINTTRLTREERLFMRESAALIGMASSGDFNDVSVFTRPVDRENAKKFTDAVYATWVTMCMRREEPVGNWVVQAQHL